MEEIRGSGFRSLRPTLGAGFVVHRFRVLP